MNGIGIGSLADLLLTMFGKKNRFDRAKLESAFFLAALQDLQFKG